MYGISYTLLGLLVLVNFVTQLTVDLIFSFFSHKFNIPLAVKIIPALTLAGLALFALAPIIFPSSVYLGLVLGTVVFSASSGFAEVQSPFFPAAAEPSTIQPASRQVP